MFNFISKGRSFMQDKPERKWLASLAIPVLLALLLSLNACSSGSSTPVAEEPTPDPPIVDPDPPVDPPAPVASNYLGAQICSFCHQNTHAEWKTSWHTRKSTWGPAASPEVAPARYRGQAARDKFLPGVITMWEAGQMDSYMILDRDTNITAADQERRRDPLKPITNKNIVTKKKFNWDEVEVIVGETRKQRYAVYYDGGPVAEALNSYSDDQGATWWVDTEGPTVSFAGNLQRAGYKFLTIEMDALRAPDHASYQKPQMYGEFYSWQERCIGCHTTGFQPEAWSAAKAAYISSDGQEGHLRDIYVADIEIACEACHGPGMEHVENKLWQTGRDTIINPAKLALGDPTRKMVCEQCHTRTGGNLLYPGAPNDNRGFVLGEHDFMDVMRYTRPDWTNGNRQVSLDGKGRRDHQQDMDIRLTPYTQGSAGAGFHGILACFDCHDSHNVGNAPGFDGVNEVSYATSQNGAFFTTASDQTGLIRLKETRLDLCGQCHAGQVELYLSALDGRAGWDGPNPSFGNFDNFKGRPDRKQHIFNFEDITQEATQRSFGLAPHQYTWGRESKGNWVAIWPWEVGLDRYTATHTGEFPPN
jgi:hypothetical protein